MRDGALEELDGAGVARWRASQQQPRQQRRAVKDEAEERDCNVSKEREKREQREQARQAGDVRGCRRCFSSRTRTGGARGGGSSRAAAHTRSSRLAWRAREYRQKVSVSVQRRSQ